MSCRQVLGRSCNRPCNLVQPKEWKEEDRTGHPRVSKIPYSVPCTKGGYVGEGDKAGTQGTWTLTLHIHTWYIRKTTATKTSCSSFSRLNGS